MESEAFISTSFKTNSKLQIKENLTDDKQKLKPSLVFIVPKHHVAFACLDRLEAFWQKVILKKQITRTVR